METTLELTIRRVFAFDSDDIEHIADLLDKSFGDGYVSYQRVQQYAELGLVVGAYFEKRLVGAVLISGMDETGAKEYNAYLQPDDHFPENDSVKWLAVELRLLVVEPGYRRQGIGTTLVREVVRGCVEDGYQVFFAISRIPSVSDQPTSRGALRNLGFQQVATVEGFFSQDGWTCRFCEGDTCYCMAELYVLRSGS